MSLVVSYILSFYASFDGTLFGFPALYLSLFFLLLHFSYSSFSSSVVNSLFTSSIFIPLSIFYIISPFFSSFKFNSIGYLIGFLVATISVYFFDSLIQSPIAFRSFSINLSRLLYIGIFGSICAFFIQGLPVINFNFLFLYTDPNLLVFVSGLLLPIFYYSRLTFPFLLVLIFGLLSASRTFIILITLPIVFFLFYSLLRLLHSLRFRLSLSKIIIAVVSVLFFILLLPNISTGLVFIKAVLSGDFNLLVFDTERFLLLQSNLELLQNRFPIPIPAGLASYQDHLFEFSSRLGVRPARAHNFYISYLVEYGFLFLFVAISFIASLRLALNHSILLFSLRLSVLFSLCFQEFFLSPYTFIILFSKLPLLKYV